MFCRNCGAELNGNEAFCGRCGTPVEAAKTEETTYTQPAYEFNAHPNIDNVAKDMLAGSILTWGILSLAFSMSAFLSFLGLIFSFVARSKVNAYELVYGPTEGKATVGKGLSKAGLIVGIAMIAYMAFCFMIGFLGAMI